MSEEKKQKHYTEKEFDDKVTGAKREIDLPDRDHIAWLTQMLKQAKEAENPDEDEIEAYKLLLKEERKNFAMAAKLLNHPEKGVKLRQTFGRRMEGVIHLSERIGQRRAAKEIESIIDSSIKGYDD